MAAINRGIDAVKNAAVGGASHYLRVEPDTQVKIVPLVGLDEMLSIQQHAFWKKGGNSPIFPCIADEGDCPGCQKGARSTFRAFLPVAVKEEGATVVKIWSFGITMAKELVTTEEAIGGSLAGRVFVLKRTGAGVATRWSIVNTGATKDVSEIETPFNLEDELGPTDRGEILLMMRAGGVDIDDITTPDEKKELGGTEKKDDDWD